MGARPEVAAGRSWDGRSGGSDAEESRQPADSCLLCSLAATAGPSFASRHPGLFARAADAVLASAARNRHHAPVPAAPGPASTPLPAPLSDRQAAQPARTGSTDGLGRAAARVLIDEGHDVVLHARTRERAASVADLAPRAAGVVIGDLASAAETRGLAEQVNDVGRMDAVIHNAGIFLEPSRGTTAEGHAKTLAVNTLAPYMLTTLIDRPDRLIYLSSGMHQAGAGSLRDIDWTERRWNAAKAYAESKLHIVALALAAARAWPGVLSNAVDPGLVRTKMGGPGAPDDLEMGSRTQTWLAVSNDPAATVSGGYWYHQQRQAPAREARDRAFQNMLMDRLAALTRIRLF